jgi:hypothetical protein
VSVRDIPESSKHESYKIQQTMRRCSANLSTKIDVFGFVPKGRKSFLELPAARIVKRQRGK